MNYRMVIVKKIADAICCFLDVADFLCVVILMFFSTIISIIIDVFLITPAAFVIGLIRDGYPTWGRWSRNGGPLMTFFKRHNKI